MSSKFRELYKNKGLIDWKIEKYLGRGLRVLVSFSKKGRVQKMGSVKYRDSRADVREELPS